MTNSTKETKPVKPEQNAVMVASSKNKPNQKPSILPGLATILALIAIIFSSYNFYLNQTAKSRQTKEADKLTDQLGLVEKGLQQIQSNFASDAKNYRENQQNVQAQINKLTDHLNNLIPTNQEQTQTWLLQKARFYLEMEQMNTFWTDDYASSIALFKNADTLLAKAQGADIYNLRKTIAKGINQLQSAQTLDKAGILSQISAAQAIVPSLKINKTPELDRSDNADVNPTDSANTDWKARFKDSINLFEKLVIIRRNDEAIKPIISPLYEALIKEGIQLNLAEAQWAVLNNDPQIYALGLNSAIKNIKSTFDNQANSTKSILNALNDLKQVQLTTTKPKTGQALKELNDIIKSQQATLKPNNSEGAH